MATERWRGRRRCPVATATAALLAVLLLAATGVASAGQDDAIRFEDRSLAWGIRFRHDNGATGRRHLPETMGSGLAWLDYDIDGRADLYLVDSGPLPGSRAPVVVGADRTPGANVLYRNVGGAFEPAAGVAADRGYGKGVSAADYDDDGYVDLYVTNWGADRLYRNNGDGTFSDVTEEAGLGDPRLTSSAAWADLDGDTFLDLFVVTYVDYDMATAPLCQAPEEGIVDYCHPAIFDGQPDILYRNRGDGTFEDRSDGLELTTPGYGKGLAVAVADLDADGRPDVYVANDTTPNFVYLNRGGMRFVEEGELSGAGVGDDGRPQAGMGIGVGDLDGDLATDLVVTNFAREPYNLYRSIAPGFYVDDTYVLGLGGGTLPRLGFGIITRDLDLDGDLDVAVANGHILRERVRTAQPNQVFTSRMTELRAAAVATGRVAPPGYPRQAPPQRLGWRPSRGLLEDSTAAAGPAFARPRVSRGMAVGDPDGDGWPDVAVTNVGSRAQLLINTTTAGDRRVVVLRLRAREGNRLAIGARVWVTPCDSGECGGGRDGVAGFPQPRTVRTAASFASQGTTDLHFGLGSHDHARVLVQWPGGGLERVDLQAGRLVAVWQGRGIVAWRSLRPRR